MATNVISVKPTSPGRRFLIKSNRKEIYKGRPYSKLTKSMSKSGGRNNFGRITTRHIGGGHRKIYRIIDFLRKKDNIIAKIDRIEYDPNRSAYIALVLYKDGERKYIIAPKNLKIGDEIISGVNSPIKTGNCLPIKNIPVGSVLHCIELKPGKGAQLIRSAGGSAQLIAKEGKYASIKLKSTEVRKILVDCRATLGEISNEQHNLCSFGKAGAKRWIGVRPHVRGVAMNPIDHPHGGGEGKTSGGRHPVSPTGVPAKGYRTRNNKRTDKYIVKSRHKK